MRVLTTLQMNNWERTTIENYNLSSSTLMESAGRAVVTKILSLYPRIGRYIILCGNGNNGGDGLVIARTIAKLHQHVLTFMIANDQNALSPDCLNQLMLFEKMGCQVTWVSEYTSRSFLPTLFSNDILVDALFGTGFSLPVKGWKADVFDSLISLPCPVISIDIPSGLDPNSSIRPSVYIKAEHTITFGALKPCHVFFPAADICGKVHLVDIGLIGEPSDLMVNTISPTQLPSLTRQKDTHKYDYGHVLIIAGSLGMSGAAVLAAKGALSSGAGLVTVMTDPKSVDVIACQIPTVMVIPWLDDTLIGTFISNKKVTSVLIGPGLVKSKSTESMLKAMISIKIPLVIDATALTLLADNESLQTAIRCRQSTTILTPHTGEASRLIPMTNDDINNDPIAAARVLFNKLLAITLIKGARTVIASSDKTIWVSTSGNPGMATGGSGDILAGILSAFMHQFDDIDSGVKLGCYAHGLAGDLAAKVVGQISLSPLDILTYLPLALAEISRQQQVFEPSLIESL